MGPKISLKIKFQIQYTSRTIAVNNNNDEHAEGERFFIRICFCYDNLSVLNARE